MGAGLQGGASLLCRDTEHPFGEGCMGRTARMMFGMLPSSAMTCRRDTASTLPTMSLIRVGLYFSTWGGGGRGRQGDGQAALPTGYAQ